MALEAAQFISELVRTNPPGTDLAVTMDDQLRLIKNVLANSFGAINSAVNATPAQLNGLTNLTNSRIIVSNASGILTASTVPSSKLSVIGNNLVANRLPLTDGSGNLVTSVNVTDTEAEFLDGVTSNLQTQLDGKSGVAHDHTGGSETPIPAAGIAANAITQAKIQTDVFTAAGSLPPETKVEFAVSGYAFFPHIHATPSGALGLFARLVAHATDAASADAPRFGLYHPGSAKTDTALTYDIDWRFINA